jgi:hypothetical protein
VLPASRLESAKGMISPVGIKSIDMFDGNA